jgi:hypothetical protein
MKRTKERKHFEQWALPQLKRIQKVLLLEHFEPLEIEFGERLDKDGTYAESQFYYPYQSITIRYSDSMLQDFKKGLRRDIISCLTHEMCHPLTDPLYDKGVSRYVTNEEVRVERERLTDHIANIVLKNKLV